MRASTAVLLSLVVLAAASSDAVAQKKKHGGGAPPSAPAGDTRGGGRSGTAAGAGTGAADARALNTLTLACSTANADVFVDGEKIGLAPIELPVPVTNGSHTIKVTKLGFAPYIDVFTAKPGVAVKLDVELLPISGVLHVKSALPGSRVLLDGKYVGDAPTDVEMDAGAHAVQVSKQCYNDFFENVMSVAGQEVVLDAKLAELPPATNPCRVVPPPPPKWYQKKWVWGVVGGVALAAAAGATVGAVLATRNTDPLANADFRFDVAKSTMGLRFGR